MFDVRCLMSDVKSQMVDSPLVFIPIFQERIWGGRNFAEIFGKNIPPGKRIGEAWEIVDRPEAQSIVANGPYRGRSLHDLWINERRTIFGDAPDAPRFPLLIKLLDCCEKLSLQVHPPEKVAAELGAESKTEFWYIARASGDAELYLGLKQATTPQQFKEALKQGGAAELIHRVPVKKGDGFFIPSGRVHAIGGGNLIVEIQQNSDTTYRAFDWNRRDDEGKQRELHIEQALRCIDFSDTAPQPVTPRGELLMRNELFEIQRWNLDAARPAAPTGQFAIIYCISGSVECGGVERRAGEFMLVPALLPDREISPTDAGAMVLQVTIPR